jgi:VWFA-related protein
VLSFFRSCILLVLPTVSSLVLAQSQTAIRPSNYEFLVPVTTITKQVNEVNLAFTVTDHHGRFVSNLRPEDIRLLDNQLSPARFTFFQQRSDLPLHLAVLIDVSSSVTHRFKAEQEAAMAFIKKILHSGNDQAMVIAFNDRVTLIQSLTGQTARVSQAITQVNPGGNTALYDAVIYAADKLRRIPESGITRRAIVLVTDGVDTVSGSTLLEVQAAATRDEVMIFSLTTNTSDGDPSSQGDAILKQLASASGGVMLPAQNEGRMSSSLRTIERTLHNQYVLAYSPPEFRADGTYHAVEIVPAKKGLRAHCRKGYYAGAAIEALKTHP